MKIKKGLKVSRNQEIDEEDQFTNDLEELPKVWNRTYIVHSSVDPIVEDKISKNLVTALVEDNVKAFVAYAKNSAVVHTLTAKHSYDSRYCGEVFKKWWLTQAVLVLGAQGQHNIKPSSDMLASQKP